MDNKKTEITLDGREVLAHQSYQSEEYEFTVTDLNEAVRLANSVKELMGSADFEAFMSTTERVNSTRSELGKCFDDLIIKIGELYLKAQQYKRSKSTNEIKATIRMSAEGQMHIIPDSEYDGIEKFVWQNREKTIDQAISILPF